MAIVKKDRADVGMTRKERRQKKQTKRDAVPADVDLSLPKEMTEPIDDLGQCVILISGEKKIGKSSLSAQFGKNLNMAFEIGYKGLRIYKKDIPDWDTARAIVRQLKKDKTFNTVTIDTADKAFKRCEDWSNRKLGIEHASEEEWGKGWASIRNEFERFVDTLTHTGKGVILISHTQEKEVKRRNGESYDRIMPTLPKQGREIVEGLVDIFAHYQYDGDRRILTILGDDHISAGHRFSERFRTPDGHAIRHIDMGKSPEEGHANFVAAWNNEYEPTHEDDVVVVKKKKKSSTKSFKLS